MILSMATKGEKFIISLILSVVLILNISVPVVYAVERTEEKIESLPQCNFSCNLKPSMAKDSGKVLCPHHLKESRKKKLANHFQCKIGPANCQDKASLPNTASAVDPYLLSKYPMNEDNAVSFLALSYPTISSQTIISFLERPPNKHNS